MRMNTWHGLGVLVAVMTLGACAGPSRNVQRVASDTQTDLSGKWNDTDARLTSEALIGQCFSAPWLADFVQEQGRKPTMRVRTASSTPAGGSAPSNSISTMRLAALS